MSARRKVYERLAIVALAATVVGCSESPSKSDLELWKPNPKLVEQLLPETHFGEFAIRTFPGLNPVEESNDTNVPGRSFYRWSAMDLSFGVVITVTRGLHPSPGPAYLAGRAQELSEWTMSMAKAKSFQPETVEHGRIGDMQFARLRYQLGGRGFFMTEFGTANKFNCIWIGYDDTTEVSLQISSDYAFDSEQFALAEASAYTLRALK
jgi:hypothetical protein